MNITEKHSFDMTLDTQIVFRKLLEALSNPGRTLSIAESATKFSSNGAWLALSAAMLDNEATFYWNGSDEIGEELRFLTGSCGESPQKADFLLLPNHTEPYILIPQVKRGTYIDPHLSATLIIGSSGEGIIKCRLGGPGIPPEGREVSLTAYERDWILARDAMNYEYPLGIELIFMREGGLVTAITRKAAAAWHM